MKKILDYRLVILANNGNIIPYTFDFGMHQDCLDDFAKKNKYEYSSEDYIVKNGNVIFKNAGLNILVAYLPKTLSDEQLYQLDYIHNWLNDVTMFEAYKYLDNNDKQWYQCMDNVSDYFSEEIIQSYYSKRKR